MVLIHIKKKLEPKMKVLKDLYCFSVTEKPYPNFKHKLMIASTLGSTAETHVE